jgi:hypothetical protein
MLGDSVRRQQAQDTLAGSLLAGSLLARSLLLLLLGFTRSLRLALGSALRECGASADGERHQQRQQVPVQRDEMRSGHAGLSRFFAPPSAA